MIYTGAFFLFIFLSGFWLSRAGKPYNGLIFNIHKLIGLGTGIYLVRMVYLSHRAAPLGGVQWTAIIITVLLFVFAVAAGGLLSAISEGSLKNVREGMLGAIESVHKVSPYLIVVATGVTLFLLLVREI
jgi:hypothetical protein